MKLIHGHEVLNMMLESGETYTKESLTAEVLARFGAEARFFTCSAENMTAGELVAFLEKKGKLVRREGGFNTSADVMCKH